MPGTELGSSVLTTSRG